MGQLSLLLRAKYLVDAEGFNKIQGQPFKVVGAGKQDSREVGKQDRAGAKR